MFAYLHVRAHTDEDKPTKKCSYHVAQIRRNGHLHTSSEEFVSKYLNKHLLIIPPIPPTSMLNLMGLQRNLPQGGTFLDAHFPPTLKIGGTGVAKKMIPCLNK